jgi:YbgC/YbaW family acyl-CoA thioester hydrolase
VHEVRIPTRWTDFDALGHITHAAYPVFLDEARDAYLTEAVGSFDEWPWVVAHVSIDYRHELRLPTREVVVRTAVAETGRTSVTFEQQVLGPAGTCAVEARSVVVAWDDVERRPRELGADDAGRLQRG